MIPAKAAGLMRKALREGTLACLTGAGISAESGIPTFRGKDGLWERYDPGIYGYPQGLTGLLRQEPKKLADFIVDFYKTVCSAVPNPAHTALADLERAHRLTAVITQNIDNLHQQAGSRNVIELHGNCYRIRCVSCAKALTYEKDRLRELTLQLKRDGSSKIKIYRTMSRYFPRCSCKGRFRIDVVLFSEVLPHDQIEAAYENLRRAAVLLIIGTSLNVYPAASLPVYAREHGAVLVEINREPSALSRLCDFSIPGKASEIVPRIAGLLQ